jgi:predicted nucleic acid-binding Zn ribbon protein
MSWRDHPFRRYRDGPQPMSRGVERVMKHLDAPKAGIVESIFNEWPRLAGEVIAAHSTPQKVTNGVLHLEVDDPAWASEMQWMSEELLRRISTMLETVEITEIKVHLSR